MRKAILLLAGAFLLGSAFAIFAQDAKEGPKYGLEVGDMAMPVELQPLHGKDVLKTGELKKPTVFMLVSSVCTACSAEMKEVAMNIDKFKAFDVVSVVIDIDPDRAADQLSKYNFPMFSDKDWKFGNAVGLASAPSVVILDKEGKILYKKYGYKGGQWKEYAEVK